MAGHAAQYAAQTGQPLEEVMRRFGLEEPEIPEGFEQVWAWFWELAQGRGSTGFGPLPLAWADMTAWAHMGGIELAPWLGKLFRRMDLAWLDEYARAQPKKGK